MPRRLDEETVIKKALTVILEDKDIIELMRVLMDSDPRVSKQCVGMMGHHHNLRVRVHAGVQHICQAGD